MTNSRLCLYIFVSLTVTFHPITFCFYCCFLGTVPEAAGPMPGAVTGLEASGHFRTLITVDLNTLFKGRHLFHF